jgi:N-acetylneuraminic acid mutarotase
MGTRFVPQSYHRRSPLFLLPLFLASLSMASCGLFEVGIEGEDTPGSGDPMATVAALATENARLATRVAALVGENAQQADQLAVLATGNARQATQVVALATENAQQSSQIAALAGETSRRATPLANPTAPAPAEPWQWSSAGSMTTARSYHTATLLPDGRALLAAGQSGVFPDVSLSSAEIYDPVSGTFRATASLNTVRHQHSATLLPDGRVLVIGGYNPSQGWLSSAEIYDPATGQWSITQPIFAHGVTHTATLLKDGRVLVMAGAIQSGSAGQSGTGGPDDRVEIFDPKTNRWQQAALHENTGGNHTATLLPDGRVLIAGGSADPAIYDPASDTWQPAGSLAVERCFTRAVLLQDGRVLLIGGLLLPQGGTALNSVEIYDPASNAWRQAAPLAQARFEHTGTLLPDGRVLVTGGTRLWDAWDDPGAFLSSVEMYDPASDTWSALPPLQQARVEHTATLLPDGRVLVTGGHATRNAFLDSVEILKLDAQ